MILTDDQKRDLFRFGRVYLPGESPLRGAVTLAAVVQACDIQGIDQRDVILPEGWLTVERDA